MKVLVIGSGGREHALCWKIAQSEKLDKLYCVPGNAGTALCAENHEVDIMDNDAVKVFCEDKSIDLVVIGPELPLSRGLTDVLESEGILVCAPSYAAARMESSKIFSKELMGRMNIPTAEFRVFNELDKAEKYIKKKKTPLVVKADGLAAGKGVTVASTESQAIEAARSMLEDKVFGAAGNKIIVEECLVGEEVSVIVVTDGTNIVPLASSQDHKRSHDGDKGPNTGGMGAYSPAPVLSDALYAEIYDTILKPTVDGLREEDVLFKGFLYAGIMVTEEGPKVLEYNVRFGDPEAQVILPRLKTDFLEVLTKTAEGDVSGLELEWIEDDCICVVLASGGYPGKYEKGMKITGLEDAEKEGVTVFHAGTKMVDGEFVTSGGRVLNVVGTGKTILEAIDSTYRGVSKISFDGMFYRKDIAYRAVKRVSTSA